MSFVRRNLCRATIAAAALTLAATVALPRAADPLLVNPNASPDEFELAETVRFEQADSSVMRQLERAKAYLADRQWDDGVETLRQVMENASQKLMAVTPQRYVGLRDYVHLQLATLPPEALKLYRSRVDPSARKWYDEGIANRDRQLLLKVIDEAFACSWGDEAIFALGEMSLEAGDYRSARWYWERIVPAQLPDDAPRTWPGYPDSNLDLAAIRARLVLVSILERATDRARTELAQFARLHPGARGHLGGRVADYAETLKRLLAESSTWPPSAPMSDWPTLAGSTSTRNAVAAPLIDVGKPAWSIPLTDALQQPPATTSGAPTPRRLLHATASHHPVITGDLVLTNTAHQILAVQVSTGKPAWGSSPAIYRAALEAQALQPLEPSRTLGTPCYTMTVFDGKLYARMGSSVTSRPNETTTPMPSGYLVCLDLAAQGRLAWKIIPDEGWSFEGSPVADQTSVYVAMRRSDVYPEAHVACFDAQTGSRRWTRLVCGAELPASSLVPQRTHNLLTLDGETLFYNTNLGAVAALSTRDGRLLWLSLYPRQRRGNLADLPAHWQRQLNPCLLHRGALLVAPADSPRIFALDAATGQVLWQTGTEVQDALHLLGATDDYLIAGGGKLYWISLKEGDSGRVKHVWPDGPEQPGHGRGILAGSCVLWPTRDKIMFFDQQTAQPKKVIDLAPLGLIGGNLFIARGSLLIATDHDLTRLTSGGDAPSEPPQNVVASSPNPFMHPSLTNIDVSHASTR